MCSNTFRMSAVDAQHDVAAIDWLQTILVVAKLPDGRMWLTHDSDAVMCVCVWIPSEW